MSPAWRIGSSIFTDGFIAEHIERYLREECTYRKRMDGNVHWGSRPWKTKSSNRPWSVTGCLRYGGVLFAAGARNTDCRGHVSSPWLHVGFLNRARFIPFRMHALPP